MDKITQTSTVAMHTLACGPCGGVYAITEWYHHEKLEKGGYWTCPYCKCSWGYGKGDLQRAREKAERLERDAQRLREQRDAAIRREIGQKAAKTRIKNRIARGVCPCCNRTFVNLAKHMASQHPSYAGGDDEQGE